MDTRITPTGDGHMHAVVPGASVAVRGATLSRSGLLSVRLSCMGPGGCVGRMASTARSGRLFLSLGGRRFAIPEFSTQVVRLRLTRSARRELARRGRLRIQVRAHVFGASGPGIKTIRQFTLRRPKRA